MAAWLEIICMGRKGRCLWRTKSSSLSNKLREPLVTLGWQLWIAGQCLLHLFLPVIQGACASGGGVAHLAKFGVWQRHQATVTSKTLRDIYRTEKIIRSCLLIKLEASPVLPKEQSSAIHHRFLQVWMQELLQSSGSPSCSKSLSAVCVNVVLMIWEPLGTWAEPCFSFWTEKKRHQIQAKNRDKGTSLL